MSLPLTSNLLLLISKEFRMQMIWPIMVLELSEGKMSKFLLIFGVRISTKTIYLCAQNLSSLPFHVLAFPFLPSLTPSLPSFFLSLSVSLFFLSSFLFGYLIDLFFFLFSEILIKLLSSYL